MSSQSIHGATGKYRRVVLSVVVLTAMLVGILLPRPVQAATVCYVDADAAGPTHNGLTWGTAFTLLQDAIASPECTEQIWVAAGTYIPGSTQSDTFALHAGVELYGGFAGGEDELTDRDWELNETILSGEIGDAGDVSDNIYHVVRLINLPPSDARLDGFVITLGFAEDTVNPEGVTGGGMLSDYSTAVLANLTFRGNTANNKGGGLSMDHSALTLQNVTFDNNTSNRGGGLHISQDSGTSLQNVLFTHNTGNTSGGAIYFDSATSHLTDVTFQYNRAGSAGGAIYVYGGQPVIEDSFFSVNSVDGSAESTGGAIAIDATGSVAMNNVTVEANTSTGLGGGLYVAGSSIFRNILVTENTAVRGGGMLFYSSGSTVESSRFIGNTADNFGGGVATINGSTPTFVNSIIAGNNAAIGGGGGAEVWGPHSSPSFINCTFYANSTGGTGGAIMVLAGAIDNPTHLTNSIVWGNSSPQLATQAATDSTLLATYNDVEGGYTGTGNIQVNPMFLDPTGDDEIAGTVDDNLKNHWTSLVIDAGDNSAVPGGLLTDFNEDARFVNMLNITDSGNGTAPLVDMGPFESQMPDLVVTKTASPTTTDEGGEVTYTITVLNQGEGTAHDLRIEDPLVAGLSLAVDPALEPADAGTAGTAPVLFQGITLDQGEQVTVTYTVTALDGPASPQNTVTVYPTEIPAGVTQSATVTVNNVAPIANAGADSSANEGSPFTFSGSAVDPAGTHDTYTYDWNFGDGTTATNTTLTPQHTYADNGTFTVTLTVTDSDNASDSDQMTLTVNNVVPQVNAGADPTGVDEGEQVSFSGSYTDPAGANDGPYSVSWNWGDGTANTTGTLTPTHTFADSGTYTVTLTVTEAGNEGSGSDTLTVDVDNVVPQVNAGADPTGVDEGEQVSFSGSYTDPAGANDAPYSVSWNWGDGTANTTGTLTPTHTYADSGTYTVTLTVTDADLESGSDTLTVDVDNVVPQVNAGADQTGVDEGEQVSFSGSYTDPAGANDAPYTVSWNWGDGTANTTGTLTPTHTFADSGTYTVTLTVTDGDLESGSDTLTVDVDNVAPQVDAGADQLNQLEGALLSFNGSYTDPAGAEDVPYTITWNWGDGTANTTGTLTPTHRFPDNGTYTVTLTVEDKDLDSGSDNLTVTTTNVAPNADAGPDQTVDEGDLVTFDGDPGDPGYGDTFTYQWNFGDGSAVVTGSSAAPTHTYADEGTYTVTMTVTDDEGASDTDNMTVTVNNVNPVVNAGTDINTDEGTNVSFAGIATDAGVNDHLTISWNFGDGTSASGSLTPSHSYGDNGTYTVTLTVIDGDNGSAQDSLVVTVDNVDPVVSAGENFNLSKGSSATFHGSYTDAGEDDSPFTIEWDFGDGETASGTLTPTHTYADEGVYTVTLTVTDKDGGIGTDTITVDVSKYFRFVPFIRMD